MKVEEEYINKMGIFYGGLIVILVDSILIVVLLFLERGVFGVSVDMNITYVFKLYFK